MSEQERMRPPHPRAWYLTQSADKPIRPPRPPACDKCDALWTPGHVCEETPTGREIILHQSEDWRESFEFCCEIEARLRQRILALAKEMEDPNTEHGTMPRVRMRVRREWAARLRGLADG